MLASQVALLPAVLHPQVGDESITVFPSFPGLLLLGTGLRKGFGPRRVLLMGVEKLIEAQGCCTNKAVCALEAMECFP